MPVDLGKVAIGIKTFLRDPQLFHTIKAIRDTMPEVEMIIADCGEPTEEKSALYNQLRKVGHQVIELPYDSGFGYMSNWIASGLNKNRDKKYLLIASDDFDFSPPEVRDGIEELARVLELCDVDIASGRVNNQAYEFDLIDEGCKITEVPVKILEPKPWFTYVDLTVNYSLIKRKVFSKIRWDEDAKICQGEHGAFFVDAKRAGFKTAYVSGVGISEQNLPSSDRYKQYRSRTKGRSCFVKRGITEYILGDGRIDYRA